MDNIETLLERFVEDRDQLDDDELDLLVEVCNKDAAFAARLKDQLILDEVLAPRLAIDRRDFVAQVGQRIRDDQFHDISAPTANPHVAVEMRQLLDVELAAQQQLAERRRAGRWQWLATALVVMLLAGAGGWWWVTREQPIATVEQITGSPMVMRGNQSRPLQAGVAVRGGDEIATLPEEEVTLRYGDGSELRLAGDTSLRLQSETSSAGKQVELAWGTVVAEVVPQPVGRPMRFTTPLSVATVRGTRLRLSGDDARTRLDVIEGLVDLRRTSDGDSVAVRAREFAVATPSEFSVAPLAWPVDQRDAVVILETVDTTSEVRDAGSGEYVPLDFRPRGAARLDHDFAFVLSDGAVGLHNASAAILDSCQRTGELTVEATITPQTVSQTKPTQIISCASDKQKFNFVLTQQADRLLLLLRTSDQDDENAIELCSIVAGQPQHVVVTYRSGELICYLNGRRVHRDGRLQGDFRAWGRYPFTLGDAQRGGQDWRGKLEGLAIYDRALSSDEVQRNAEFYRELMTDRPNVPQVEVQATLLERPSADPWQKAAGGENALVVCRYRIEGVLRGELAAREILVASWATLNGEPRSIREMNVGDSRRMTIERFGVNTQLAAIPRIDQFNQGDDPRKPRHYEVSAP